ncbi:interleukin-18 receptor accessory protein-like [Cololabis saira]|uniref:interleukin-18 receptor accessory protein-like n=1 Tax=Cololabis saira TaxID=129043 RepID=UPI002AD58BA7|nr:interleukin-18 receptor accessory protein-like [Cololabis saira]
MQTTFVWFYLVFPVFLEGCRCDIKQQKKIKGPQQLAPYEHYRVVEGEIFMMPCIQSVKTVWSRIEEDTGGNRGSSFDCGREFASEVKHSGKYTSLNGTSVLHLQVVEKFSLGCFQLNETIAMLTKLSGGNIFCPGLTCNNNTGVVWYQKKKTMAEMNRDFCNEEGRLELCTVYESDTGVFFCDRQISEEGVMWIFRRAVNVTVIPRPQSLSPKIDDPSANMTEEVEIGRPHTLRCNVTFYYERKRSLKVEWFMNYGGNMKNTTLLHTNNTVWGKENLEWFTVSQTVIIKEVTPQHLNHTYTCTATNAAGRASVTITLKKKNQVKLPSLIGYPFVAFLVAAGLGIILYVKWLELQVIYRSRFQYGKYDGENKDFDVFLSFVWSPPSAQVQEDLTFSSKSGPFCKEVKEAAQKVSTCMNPFNSGEGQISQTQLEVLLPQVLEDLWGYRLCLLERDVLPGGAYTNDVVLGINRSQMLICVLSPEYLTNSNAVFVLESGVQALLQKSVFKLLPIWTGGASASLIQTDTALSRVVRRSLNVLPSLKWRSETSPTANSIFWSSLRKAMPYNRNRTHPVLMTQS